MSKEFKHSMNDANSFLYSLEYQEINSSSINISNIINFKNQMDILIVLSIFKNILSGLNLLIFAYFSIILILEEKVKKSYFMYISISFIFFILCHLVIISICLDINIKYIQSFKNRIIKDFENNKINYIWTLILIFFIIFYLIFLYLYYFIFIYDWK